ncbi:MAG: NB-ARC domain-containing protein [Bacteroidota bacterium]
MSKVEEPNYKNCTHNAARLLMKVVLTVEKWESKPGVFSKCEWDDNGERIEVKCGGWKQLAEYIQTDFLDEWDENKYCKKGGFRNRLKQGLDFLEKGLRLACYSNRDEASGHRHKDNKFELINLPEISVDVDTCLRLFDRRYKEFQKNQADNKSFKSNKNANVLSDLELTAPHNLNSDINPFDIPYQRNRFFTGRKSVIEQIHTQLNQETAIAITQVQAISGLGGIGKTQTAVEYAYRYYYDQKSYDYVFWVKADTESNLITDFAGLANQLALPVAKETEKDKIPAVRAWLNTHDNWLLIFDNADTPGWLISLMPNNPKGRILMTSRASLFDELGINTPVALDVMSLNEAIDFLFLRTGYETTESNLAAATDLNQELGGLPLALEQRVDMI